MFRFTAHCLIFALSSACLFAEPAATAPKLLQPTEIKDFSEMEETRKKLVETALVAAREVVGMPYKYGGNGSADGGFDCSGAIYHILRKAGLEPPRSSSEQFLWVKEFSKFHPIPETAKDTDDPSFSALKPGDLIFWSGTYAPTDGRKTKITHVAMFIGHEKSDGRAVMINATDGRSYRGQKGNGLGVYDFHLPRAGRKSKMVGYGTPPGLLGKPD